MVIQKIGDTIYYVDETIIKPTHIQKGNRMVRVRYEAVKRFVARSSVIKTIGFNPRVFFNYGIWEIDICETMENTEILAKLRQERYDKHCRFSEQCR